MLLDPHLSFATDTALTTAVGALLTSVAAVAGASVIVPAITRRILPAPKETHLSDFLPFEAIDRDGFTVLLKNESISRYYLVAGVDQSFLESNEQLAALRHRKAFLDSLSEAHVTARIFTIRRKMPIGFNDGFPNEIAETVARKWNEQFQDAYRTLNIICLTAKTRQKMDEAQQSLESTLSPYGVHHLTQDPDANPEKLTLGEFLGSITSPASCPAPKTTGDNLSDVLAGDVVWFRPDGIIEFTSGTKKKYAVAIGLKRIGDDISLNMASELSSLSMEMSISRYVQPMSKAEAIIKLEQHSRLATASSFNPAATLQQFQVAQAMVEGSDDTHAALCSYCSTIFIYAESIEQLLSQEDTVRNIITSNGATPVRETGATQASWFLQFPTLDLMPRPYRLFSTHIAFDYVLDRPAAGLPRSDWGEGAIANFKTISNTLYQHQFHISEDDGALGHGVVIAPTGVGKTVLMEFLSLMSSRHKNLKHFFFDRYRGTAIYNLAMGGKYLSLNADPLPWSEGGAMNPFDCDDTEENRSFLKLWISSITGCDGNDDLQEIWDAVDIAFDELDRGERSLSTIHEAAFSPGSKVRNALEKWVSETGYGPIFNAEKDSIDVDGSWLTTFDMTSLLEDPKLGAATVHYLMHKIRNTLQRNDCPGFIFIDETEPLLRDPNFRRLFTVALQEFRKKHGVVISVFQRPEAIAEAGVSQLVRQQSGTYYLFQNPGARASDYGEFELTERELAFVLGQSGVARKAKRSLLIKRPLAQESVIVDIDLSNLGPHLKIFSSSSKDIGLVSDLYRKLEGKWIERYLDHDAP